MRTQLIDQILDDYAKVYGVDREIIRVVRSWASTRAEMIEDLEAIKAAYFSSDSA